MRLYLDGSTNSGHAIDLRIHQRSREKIMLGIPPSLTDCGLSDFCTSAYRSFRCISVRNTHHCRSGRG
jgi:hypothetical protein